jgi:hypothetical protein
LTSFRVTCETTFASPTYSEIEEVKKLVVNAKTWCAQGNPGGSKCTAHASYKGGQLALCGSSNKSMKCEDLAWAAG